MVMAHKRHKQHYSHMEMGGIKLTFGKRGISFTRKPNRRNNCIKDAMKGKKLGTRSAVKAEFSSLAKSCK